MVEIKRDKWAEFEDLYLKTDMAANTPRTVSLLAGALQKAVDGDGLQFQSFVRTVEIMQGGPRFASFHDDKANEIISVIVDNGLHTKLSPKTDDNIQPKSITTSADTTTGEKCRKCGESFIKTHHLQRNCEKCRKEKVSK